MNAWQVWLEDLFLRGTVKLTVFDTHEVVGCGIEAEIRYMPHSYKEAGWIRQGWGNSFDEAMDALHVGVQ